MRTWKFQISKNTFKLKGWLHALMKATHIFAFVSLVVCSGCGTIISRSSIGDMAYVKIPQYFPATFVDSRLIVESFPDTSAGARAFWCVGGVIDLPISLVLDTMPFPFDACKSPKQTSSSLEKPLGPTQQDPIKRKDSQDVGDTKYTNRVVE